MRGENIEVIEGIGQLEGAYTKSKATECMRLIVNPLPTQWPAVRYLSEGARV